MNQDALRLIDFKKNCFPPVNNTTINIYTKHSVPASVAILAFYQAKDSLLFLHSRIKSPNLKRINIVLIESSGFSESGGRYENLILRVHDGVIPPFLISHKIAHKLLDAENRFFSMGIANYLGYAYERKKLRETCSIHYHIMQYLCDIPAGTWEDDTIGFSTHAIKNASNYLRSYIDQNGSLPTVENMIHFEFERFFPIKAHLDSSTNAFFYSQVARSYTEMFCHALIHRYGLETAVWLARKPFSPQVWETKLGISIYQFEQEWIESLENGNHLETRLD